jgi:hypothetical protein
MANNAISGGLPQDRARRPGCHLFRHIPFSITLYRDQDMSHGHFQSRRSLL